jgi:hypothetical protein
MSMGAHAADRSSRPSFQSSRTAASAEADAVKVTSTSPAVKLSGIRPAIEADKFYGRILSKAGA